MRQPHSGRICRSPSAVPMMMRTDSSMFCSYLESWMPPFGPTEKGNLKPTPRKLLMPVPDLPPGSRRAPSWQLDAVLSVAVLSGERELRASTGGRSSAPPPALPAGQVCSVGPVLELQGHALVLAGLLQLEDGLLRLELHVGDGGA